MRKKTLPSLPSRGKEFKLTENSAMHSIAK